MASTNSTTKEKTRQIRDKDAMANAIKAGKMINVCIVMGFFLKTFMERNRSNVHHVGSGLMKNVLA